MTSSNYDEAEENIARAWILCDNEMDNAKFYQGQAIAYGLLALVDAINDNGATAKAQEQVKRNMEQMHAYLDSVNPTGFTPATIPGKDQP